MHRGFFTRAGRVALSCALMAGPLMAAGLAWAADAPADGAQASGTAAGAAAGAAAGSAAGSAVAKAASEGARQGVNELPPAPSLGAEGLKVAGILCLMLAFIFGAFWLLKRYGHRAGLGILSKSQIKLEGQLSLGPKKSVVVVRFLNKRMVLGVTDSNINLLTEMETGHDTADDTATDFTASLEEARAKDRTS